MELAVVVKFICIDTLYYLYISNEKFRLYWLGFCGKIANGLMVSLYFNMLENYSDACQMPEPHTYLRMCHHGKLSFTKVTERAAEGDVLNFKCFLLLVSVATLQK